MLSKQFSSLQERLRQKLKDQKYLLILGDVWNEDRGKWVDLKNLLMEGASGSKIVITTRNHSVASIMATNAQKIIQIQGLSDQQCLHLFLKWAFDSSQEASGYPRLNVIAAVIVKKCKGVPLAIRTLGSLLYTMREESDWIHLRDSDIWKIEQKEDGILPALKLSYYQLPSNLRRCFAFCSIFPKDYVFSSRRLTMWWQANGMLQKLDGNQDLVAVGLRYIKQLLSRGFFQEFKAYGFYESFKMHDLVHDLALLVAERDCINLNSPTSPDIFSNSLGRHISFPTDYFEAMRIPNWLLERKKNVRTIAFPNGMGDCEASFLKTCISEFNSLHILDLHMSSFQVLPSSIGCLKHLKHLDFSFNDRLQSLPASLCEVVGLETLLLFGCRNIKKLPRGIGKLIRLRTLVITTKESNLPEEIRCLMSLEDLTIFCCSNLRLLVSDEAIQCLSALLSLRIFRCENLVRLPTRGLRRLTGLERIWIEDCGNLNLMSGDDSNNSGATCSEGGEGPRNLQSLYLRHLPELEILPPWLLNGANNLKRIDIFYCDNLTNLIPEGMVESLISLHTLSIEDCRRLVSLPEGMHCLTALQKIEIRDCPELIRRCKRDTGEDWHKISHVREIILDDSNI